MNIEIELKRIAAGIRRPFQPEPLPIKPEPKLSKRFRLPKASGRCGEAFRRRMEVLS